MKNSSIGPQILFLFKNKIVYNFVKCMAIKKRVDNIIFPLLLFVIVGFGSEIRDSGSRMEKPGSGIQDKHLGSATLRIMYPYRSVNMIF
jgi:hypothetical protein